MLDTGLGGGFDLSRSVDYSLADGLSSGFKVRGALNGSGGAPGRCRSP
jgi:hypothetical protein